MGLRPASGGFDKKLRRHHRNHSKSVARGVYGEINTEVTQQPQKHTQNNAINNIVSIRPAADQGMLAGSETKRGVTRNAQNTHAFSRTTYNGIFF